MAVLDSEAAKLRIWPVAVFEDPTAEENFFEPSEGAVESLVSIVRAERSND
jgi:hypothetical protein